MTLEEPSLVAFKGISRFIPTFPTYRTSKTNRNWSVILGATVLRFVREAKAAPLQIGQISHTSIHPGIYMIP